MIDTSLAFAKKMDKEDALASYRKKFHFPTMGKNQKAIYFCGNSLGLQPKLAKQYINQELNHWAQYAVEGHMIGTNAWLYYHHLYTKSMCMLVGAKPTEVVAMNTLTVNLHLLMISFYKPTSKRYKIIMEAGAFPSDQYAMETQVKLHGLSPSDAIIEVAPREGEKILRTEDILATIKSHGTSVALIMFGGVNYYTGQLYDMKAITEMGHKIGAKVGFDLAHAAGNVPLKLHQWEVDFACWCSYKYLNAGPGAVSSVYIHEKYSTNPSFFKLAGWWGYDEPTRFQMKKGFKPMHSAASWQMSNAPVFNMIGYRASLEMFDEVGMTKLRTKSKSLTSYLIKLIDSIQNTDFELITPRNISERGAQVSLFFKKNGREFFEHLNSKNIIVDWREPGVIRLAPVPMYNSYMDVYRFYEALKSFSLGR